MYIHRSRIVYLLVALALFLLYSLTAPQNHSEAEDVYDFALKVEQGTFADQAGVNRVLALPAFGVAYKTVQALGYNGRAFPFMIFINRLLAVACVMLFWRLLGGTVASRSTGIEDDAPPNPQPSTLNQQLPAALLLAFSYGFWRYANEAETYILASAFVLGAWCLAVKGRWLWCVVVAAVGILVHLLNLVPLLLMIPFYYLLSGKWKKAVLHGLLTGLLVGLGYGLCVHYLDWKELGAHHHAEEAGLNVSNLLRGGIAFGQCFVSGNFLFGFEPFRNELVRMFPSRMLGEEFFMAQHMPSWIKWVGCVTVGGVMCVGVWGLPWRKNALECGGKQRATPLWIASVVWLILYAVAVIHTEAGSPELWIMGLIPFWIIVASLLHGTSYRTADLPPGRRPLRAGGRSPSSVLSSPIWLLVVLLFFHNLVAGLLPVMSERGDYLAKKGQWLVEHTDPEDLILTDYESLMIFYLDYYAQGQVINSGTSELKDIQRRLAVRKGEAYAVASYFQPMLSMQTRNPVLYARMVENGVAVRPLFKKIVADEFGGIYAMGSEEGMKHE